MDQGVMNDFYWLVSDEGRELLASATANFRAGKDVLAITKRLRKCTTPERSAIIVEQARLRIRGRKKFSQADEMFFSQRRLEQASGQDIANYKASRFANLRRVADVCCGIGGDLLSLAGRGLLGAKPNPATTENLETVGIDLDELSVLFAQKNLTHCLDHLQIGGQHQVQRHDFADFELGDFDGVHIDPDRRSKTRTIRGDFFQPKLSEIQSRITDEQMVAIKVAPATSLRDRFSELEQREWIGDQRECKQQVIWSGPAVEYPGHLTATCVRPDGQHASFTAARSEMSNTKIGVAKTLDRWVFEPHATILISGLTQSFAQHHGLQALSPRIDYLTGSDPSIASPLLAAFEVVSEMKLDWKLITKELNRLRVGKIVVKKRGVEQVVYDRLSRLKLTGENQAVVIATRRGKQRRAIIANVQTPAPANREIRNVIQQKP